MIPAARRRRLSGKRLGRRAAAWGDSAPAGGLVQRGCTPHFSFVVPKEKRAVHGPKRKALGALRCSGPPRATGVGVSVPAPILPGLRARYSLLRDRYCRPAADGSDGVGVQGRIWSAPLSARSASLRAARAVVGADALIGPLRRLSSTTGQRQRKAAQDVSQTSPGRRFPKGSAFPSLTAARDRQPSPASGRRAALAQTDPP